MAKRVGLSLAKLAHQLLFRDSLAAHVPVWQSALFDQRQRSWFNEATEPGEFEAEPVKSVTPKNKGVSSEKIDFQSIG